MWTFEELQRVNSPDHGQRDSILTFLLGVNAATPELLCGAADRLEELGPPYVCCFAQLPFPICVEAGEYAVKADTETVIMRLEFRLVEATIDDQGRSQLLLEPNGDCDNKTASSPLGTQVIGFIPLWGRRTLYYKNYLACLKADGLRDEVINPALQDGRGYGYKGTVVTSHSFEAELPKKMLDEFPIALRRFISNYSVLALDDIPVPNFLYGYFVMTAPGRIAYGRPPVPLTRGLLRTHTSILPVERAKIVEALKTSIREIDRFILQLQAMKRVANSGEPELAIVGAVSALEWYANRFVEPPRDRYKTSHPLRTALKMAPLSQLSEALKSKLLAAVDLRNTLVHGTPPPRGKA